MTNRILSAQILLAAATFGRCASLCAQEPSFQRTIGGEPYRLQLVFQDNFGDLDHWLVESTGKVSVQNNRLVVDCFSNGSQAATIWCTSRFSGPAVVEYNAVAATGARNLNFILYATHPDGLLETSIARTGEYSQYHGFPNYIVTYLPLPERDQINADSSTRWRIRFRQNPGFDLLNERVVESALPVDRSQRIVYILDGSGRIRLFVDGELMHDDRVDNALNLDGYHGFRTWNSEVRYSEFKVYTILPNGN